MNEDLSAHQARETWFAERDVGLCSVRGKDAHDLLHRLSTQDLRPLKGAKAGERHTILTTPQGRMVDWCRLLVHESGTFLVTSAGRAAKVKAWVDRYTIMEDAILDDVSALWRRIVIQGPHVASVCGVDELPAAGTLVMRERSLMMCGVPAITPRIELLVPASDASGLVATMTRAGARMADSENLECLRLLNGVPSPRFEFKDEVNPLELRLTALAVSFNKGCYVGQEVISRIDSYDKLARVLMGVRASTPVPSGSEGKLLVDGKEIGHVTSWLSTRDGGALGLGVVKRDAASVREVTLRTASGDASVVLEDRPFWR